MSSPILGRTLSVLAAVLLGSMLATSANATSSAKYTLQDLIDGDSFVTNGLEFSGFSVVISGDLADQIDPEDIHVVKVHNGFHLTGPLSVADGEMGDILLSYWVSTVDELELITGASLFSNGVAFGNGAQAAVDELMTRNGEILGSLSAWDTGAEMGDAIFSDEIVFDEPIREFLVEKDILLDSSTFDGRGSARISLIKQRFTTVVIPEPATLGLLGIGLVGLAGLGRRRAAR